MVIAVSVQAQTAGIWVDDTTNNPVFDPPNRSYYPSLQYDVSAFGQAALPNIDSTGTVVQIYTTAPVYKMWSTNGLGGIQFAYSADGINWIEYNSFQSLPGLTNPHHIVVLYDGGGFGGGAYTYKIWYWNTATLYGPCNTVTGAGCSIRYAESVDGINWVNDVPVFGGDGTGGSWQRGSYGPSEVIYNPGAGNSGTDPFNYQYIMYYDGTSGGEEEVGIAYSADGLTWIRHTDITGVNVPVFANGGGGTWDATHVAFGSIRQKIDGTWEMWYSGGDGNVHEGIGYATSADGLNWVRAASNPIVELGGFGTFGGLGAPGPGSWNDVRNYTPRVLYSATAFDGNGPACYYKMWRTGRTSTPATNYTIGHSCADAVLPPALTPTLAPPQVASGLFDPAINKIGFVVLEGDNGATQIDWIITITNNGNIAGDHVVVSDILPDGLQIDGVTIENADVHISGQNVTITFTSFEPGESIQFTITTTPLSPDLLFFNTACLRSNNLDGERCATGTTITLLPRTGETPLWRNVLLFGIISAFLALTMSVDLLRRKAILSK